jgi:predicted nucleic acid-binding protein
LIVVDASLVLAIVLREANVKDADSVYESVQADRLAVPAHWPAEIANALWINKRRGRIPSENLNVILEALLAFRPIVDRAPAPDQIPSLIEFAEAQKLTVYDAIYVELARAWSATLGTVDANMRLCARRLNIPLLPA